ncbi:tRNA (uracil-O(2)-)-methyltransferase [Cytospora mali]|uniref:tRNA (uracil-O(2)-)-methyltransferase n=1 Tax=Cytospora mali TaxID=578113 RepID=A0A194VB87_CYTMA|nr:tRNA (uracil-O(2)-)-methyltransferase [Valsa mali var. pyri (nom. inval.)]
MPFAPLDLGEPEAQAAAASVQLLETSDQDGGPPRWTPLFKHECSFDAAVFDKVMLNTIKNPNLNSSWLFRADILLDQNGPEVSRPPVSPLDYQPPLPVFQGLEANRLLVRRMIPRNEQRDKPLEQTCAFYAGSTPDGLQRSLIIYLPHVKSEFDMPFYHPAVKGIAFLHDWDPTAAKGTVSTHYCFFDDGDRPEKLTRTALNLLRVLHKHGEGQAAGYKKRVNHDVLVPQATLQARYATLKRKYARSFVLDWEETTDPTKHVFEDLCIAAFLIELWSQMYTDVEFPGFVDIGCGNGLLVHILNRENYSGWGFDARARKSWAKYSTKVQVRTSSGSIEERQSLETRVLLPSVTRDMQQDNTDIISDDQIHDGLFPKGTFIISNHADELTPWTPILARISDCPFIMIPCCSHNLTGARFRAPPPKDKTASSSAYNSLCEWVARIASDCGWKVEREMLRIPSTRNTAFVGRCSAGDTQPDVPAILQRYGGTHGYYDNVVKLLQANTRGH